MVYDTLVGNHSAARLSPLSTSTSISEQHSSKKSKRSREYSCSTSPPPPSKRQIKSDQFARPLSPPASIHDVKIEDDVKDVKDSKFEHVKPREIDLDGINDEIVEGVIIQLQKTSNRPHLVKELANILSQSVKIVEQSANPSAIISSRLSTYLKRPWSASSPCPVGKELETTHHNFPQRSIISPSISSAESTSEESNEDNLRCESPEVDLSSEEYEDDDSITPPTPTGSFSGRLERPVRNNRASSVGLEKDEKEFTQTARGMQKRKFNGEAPSYLAKPSDMTDMPSNISDTPMKSVESDPFFGEGRGLSVTNTAVFIGSPVVNSWDWDLRSPENIELDELDGMLDDF
ncbi:hypothetical protein DID88_003522 [Monilinia fructigena]|uniref:GDS1 winged helix domain-containing protein n=1 Tax=Monilinia fructigena TaxID=38457 RepID=A0A395IZV1_9HELO|nr:hypothetical protein DID88_003522 [Monilinia fructigena]